MRQPLNTLTIPQETEVDKGQTLMKKGIQIWEITNIEIKARIQIWKIETKIQIWKLRQRFKFEKLRL